MSKYSFCSCSPQKIKFCFLSVLLSGMLLVLSCAYLPFTTQSNQSLIETNTYLSVQQTVSASNSNHKNSTPSLGSESTQIAIDAQSTQLSQPTIVSTLEIISSSETAVGTQPDIVATPDVTDFETWMKSAKILLYEDIAGVSFATRYIKEVVDKMGLSYTDVADKPANLVSEIKSGGPDGKGWDLVIAASENRLGGTPDFIPEINDAINSNSAVIIEHFNFDAASSRQTSALYAKCGIEFQYEWGPQGNKMPPSSQVVYPIDSANPILHIPNENITMSKITDLWGDRLWRRVSHIDYGDLFQKTQGSSASFILGTKPQINDKYANLISCLDGRVIIQSYATHNYAHENAVLLWENMIYNALKSRYTYITK